MWTVSVVVLLLGMQMGAISIIIAGALHRDALHNWQHGKSVPYQMTVNIGILAQLSLIIWGFSAIDWYWMLLILFATFVQCIQMSKPSVLAKLIPSFPGGMYIVILASIFLWGWRSPWWGAF